MILPEDIEKLREKFDLSYHVNYARECELLVGFEDKDVLEVGGSLPKEFVFETLKAKSWSAVETQDYEDVLEELGGLTHKGTLLNSDSVPITNGFGPVLENQYNLFLANIEELPEEHYNSYDLIFTIATFEHIHKFPQALDAMYKALKPGGKLFSLFSPIWSSYDGYHLPKILDKNGVDISEDKSLISPWAHLAMTPSRMFRHLKGKTDHDTAATITYYIYNAPHINRFFTEDYHDFIADSDFTVERFEPVFNQKVPDIIQTQLQQLYPGKSAFGNNGLLTLLSK